MTHNDDLIDWRAFKQARAALGSDFVRILGYFREDGTKSVAAIEEAMRNGNSTGLVLPAHTLKGESYQFGAEKLAQTAEFIEQGARRCVEHQEAPDELLNLVVQMRPLFEQTLAVLDKETNPLVQRRAGGFGQKKAAAGRTFGRL